MSNGRIPQLASLAARRSPHAFVLVALLQPSCRVRAAASSWQRPSTTGRCADGSSSQLMSWWRCRGAKTAIACMGNGTSSCATPAAWMRTMTRSATAPSGDMKLGHGGVVSTASGWAHGCISRRGGLNDTAKGARNADAFHDEGAAALWAS